MPDTADALRDAMLLIAKVGGPPMLAMLVVGVLVSLLQAVTQVNEASLVFVPKLIAFGAVVLVSGGVFVAELTDFTHRVMDRMVQVGGL